MKNSKRDLDCILKTDSETKEKRIDSLENSNKYNKTDKHLLQKS